MSREESINYLKSSGMSEEQIKSVIEGIESKLRGNIELIIDEYQHEINELKEDRMQEGVSVSNAYRTGKIGTYGKAIADLKGLLESEAESEKS